MSVSETEINRDARETGEPIVSLRGGGNCPFYRDRESQANLLKSLVSDAIDLVLEDGYFSPADLRIETHYHSSRLEPHCSYAEVEVYHKYA